jgi:hypothetical protein
MPLFVKHEKEIQEDLYVKTQKQLMAMPRDQVMKKIGELKAMCNCPKCPTHSDCAKNAKEALFCALGNSFYCISENKGCICPTCPVHKQLGLTYQAFCLNGNEQTQRYSAMLK